MAFAVASPIRHDHDHLLYSRCGAACGYPGRARAVRLDPDGMTIALKAFAATIIAASRCVPRDESADVRSS